MLHLPRFFQKIELHAHLTGSITPQCLHEIWNQRMSEYPTMTLQDPKIAMSKDESWNVMTSSPLFSKYIYELCSTRASIIHSTNAVLHSFKKRRRRIGYLELRTTPRSSPSLSKKRLHHHHHPFLHRQFSSSQYKAHIPHPSPSIAKEANEVIDLAIRYQSRGIVGVDLCGDSSDQRRRLDFQGRFF